MKNTESVRKEIREMVQDINAKILIECWKPPQSIEEIQRRLMCGNLIEDYSI